MRVRKELGKPTRELFFSRLAEIAPDFKRTSQHDMKGFTWTFTRRIGDLRQSITFQRHKYDDAFTIEISWSCTNDSPFEATLKDPSAPFEQSGVRFRLGRFWESQKDVWWYVAEPNFGRSLLSVFRPASDPKAAIDAAVADAIHRIQEHALPYFDRVAEVMTGRDSRSS